MRPRIGFCKLRLSDLRFLLLYPHTFHNIFDQNNEDEQQIRERFIGFEDVLEDLLSPNPTNPIASASVSVLQGTPVVTISSSIHSIEQVTSVFAATNNAQATEVEVQM
jgi:hypothetical protein